MGADAAAAAEKAAVALPVVEKTRFAEVGPVADA